jgi:hypothetical protein
MDLAHLDRGKQGAKTGTKMNGELDTDIQRIRDIRLNGDKDLPEGLPLW